MGNTRGACALLCAAMVFVLGAGRTTAAEQTSGRAVVTDFAKGVDITDGRNDATEAIRAAIASLPLGGIVYFPKPKAAYRVSSTITIPEDDQTRRNRLVFQGEGWSKIQYVATDGSNLFEGRSPNIVMRDLQLEGNPDAGDGLHFFGDRDCQVDNCVIENFGGCGIYSEIVTFGLVISHCRIMANRVGIYIYNTNSITIEGSVIGWNRLHQIHLYGLDGIVSGNYIRENSDTPAEGALMLCEDVSALTIVGNCFDYHFSNSPDCLVLAGKVTHCRGTLVMGNKFEKAHPRPEAKGPPQSLWGGGSGTNIRITGKAYDITIMSNKLRTANRELAPIIISDLKAPGYVNGVQIGRNLWDMSARYPAQVDPQAKNVNFTFLHVVPYEFVIRDVPPATDGEESARISNGLDTAYVIGKDSFLVGLSARASAPIKAGSITIRAAVDADSSLAVALDEKTQQTSRWQPAFSDDAISMNGSLEVNYKSQGTAPADDLALTVTAYLAEWRY